MCGRYSFVLPTDLRERFALIDVGVELEPRYNVAPGQVMPVIIRDGDVNRVALMRWGLVPSWAKDPRIGYRMINARAETVAAKPAFRRSFLTRRCLVPATGFYEWQRTERGRQPYHIGLKGGQVFAFAGLYDVWPDPEGQALLTYTIITTAPNALVAPIHDRMPVILRREDEDTWLNPAVRDQEVLMPLLLPYDAASMEATPVSTRVNDPRNDSVDVIRPMT